MIPAFVKIIVDEEEARTFVQSLIDEQKFVIDIEELPEKAGWKIQWLEHKDYIDYNGNLQKDEVWITKKGEMMLVQDLTSEHAKNIVRMYLRTQREVRQKLENLRIFGEESITNINGGSEYEFEGFDSSKMSKTIH